VNGYQKPGAEVRFGDIYEASYLLSAVLRADASVIGRAVLPGKLARVLGKGLQLGRRLDEVDLPLFSPAFDARRQEDYVLGHGEPTRAILVSSNCLIADFYGYDRPKPQTTGRFLLAAIRPESADLKIVDALVKKQFHLFGLQPAPFFTDGGIVDFRRAFSVDARDLDPVDRVASLDPELLELFQVRWSAHAVRTGPDAFNRNAVKLESLLVRDGVRKSVANEVAANVAETLSHAYALETVDLEETAALLDDGKETGEHPEFLAARLRSLAGAASLAAEALESTGLARSGRD
jgi:hypothetical protein